MDELKEIRDDEIEIDLRELFFALWHKAWLIILVTVIGGALAFGYTSMFVTPMYESTSLLYIVSTSSTTTSYSDLQLSAALTEDYEVVASSRTVFEQVIDNLDLDYTAAQLEGLVSVTNPTDSHFIQITVTNSDNELAMLIANEMADVVTENIATVMETNPPTRVEDAIAALNPSSPNVMKNTLIGALLGMVMIVGVIVVVFILDDTIKDEDDVAKYLGKSTLAVLPKVDSKHKGSNKKSGKSSSTKVDQAKAK